ncbi:MAG: EI24 domain-containing protein [Pseudomonadota bacterium]
MIQALFLSIGQLFDKRVAWVFIKSLFVTIVALIAVSVGIWFGMHRLLEWIAGKLGGLSWVGDAADISTLVLILLAHFLLFRAVAIAVIGIFADEVVEAVEARHYPGAHAAARQVPFGRSVMMGLGSGFRAVLINILFSPLYLILLLTGVGTPIAFFVVNTWLLGRDLGDMVAARHMPARELAGWRRRTSFRRLRLGAVGTALFLIPGLNLLAPVLGAAMAAHAFHLGRRT